MGNFLSGYEAAHHKINYHSRKEVIIIINAPNDAFAANCNIKISFGSTRRKGKWAHEFE